MTLQQIKQKIELEIKPYRYRYENDEKNNFYYITLYNFRLKTASISIPKIIMKNESLILNKIKVLKDKYDKL